MELQQRNKPRQGRSQFEKLSKGFGDVSPTSENGWTNRSPVFWKLATSCIACRDSDPLSFRLVVFPDPIKTIELPPRFPLQQGKIPSRSNFSKIFWKIGKNGILSCPYTMRGILYEGVINSMTPQVFRSAMYRFCKQTTDGQTPQVPKRYSRSAVPFVLRCVYNPNPFLPKVVIPDLSASPLQTDPFRHRLLRQAVFFFGKIYFPNTQIGRASCRERV